MMLLESLTYVVMACFGSVAFAFALWAWVSFVISREVIHQRKLEMLDKEIELEKLRQTAPQLTLEVSRSASTPSDGLTAKEGA